MKIKTFLNNLSLYLDCKKLNIIYGAAQTGKTTLLQNFYSGFQGKLNDGFLINNTTVSKSDFDVIYIDYKNDLIDQFKLGNKSCLKLKILDSFISNVNNYNNFETHIIEFLKEVSSIFEDKINENLKCNEFININFDTKDLNEVLLQIIKFKVNNYETTSEVISKYLYLLITLTSISASKKTIFLIDNFDNSLDESYTLKIIQILKEHSISKNIIFFLSSNKSISYPYILNDFTIFYMNSFKIKEIPNIEYFLREYYINQNHTDNFSFEDFIIESGLFITYEDMKYSMNKLKTSIHYNIARMLVNNQFEISNEFNNQVITIYYENEIEKNILLKVQQFLFDSIQ